MSDANVVKLLQPGSFADPLTEVLDQRGPCWPKRSRPRLPNSSPSTCRSEDRYWPSRVVRHGHLPEREVMTGIGLVGGAQPRCATVALPMMPGASASHPRSCRRMRGARGAWRCWSRFFTSKGISTGDFEEALAALLGKDAPGLSASTIAG